VERGSGTRGDYREIQGVRKKQVHVSNLRIKKKGVLYLGGGNPVSSGGNKPTKREGR